MDGLTGWLRRVAENPVLNLLMALAVMGISLSEVEELIVSDFETMEAGHGLFLFALLHVLKTLPELLESLKKIGERLGEVRGGHRGTDQG